MKWNMRKTIATAALALGAAGMGFGVSEVFNLEAQRAEAPVAACQDKTPQPRECRDREEKAETAVHLFGGGFAAVAISTLLFAGPSRKQPQPGKPAK